MKVFDGVSSNTAPTRNTWLLHQYKGAHNVTSEIEVRLHTIKGNSENGTGPYGAIYFASHYDDIRLYTCLDGSEGCCPDPTTITSVTPSSITVPPDLGVTTLTIDGTNLAAVESLQLVGPAVVGGTITAQTETQITATFDLTGTPFGTYDLLVDRSESDNNAGCDDVIKTAALTTACSFPNVTVATIVNDRGMHGNPAHKIRLTGQNLNYLTVVRLRKSNFRDGVSNINATNLQMVGDQLEATFDLSNAEGGRWDVVFRIDNDSCATLTPNAYNKAFLVYMPELTNGSFEEGYKTPDDKTELCPMGPPDNPKAKHWDDLTEGPQYGGGHKRDGHFFGPECVNGRVQNITGNHYGGSDFITNTVSTWKLFQTIAAPNVNAQGVTTQPYNIRAEVAAKGGTEAEPVTVKMRLLDGTESDIAAVIAETVFTGSFNNNGLISSPDYNVVLPVGTQFFTDPPILTIMFEFTTSGAGVTGAGYYGFWIDNVRTGGYVPPFCSGRHIWADNNGDTAVDMLDFADLQACLTSGGLGQGQTLPENCVCFDRDYNEQINDADVVEFIKCATGPAIPWSAEAAPLCTP